MKYILKIEFKNDNEDIIYDGVSFVKKNLIDHLVITPKSIGLYFERKSSSVDEKLFDSPNSLYRYQIQRALCFYLVTQGNIPEVDRIVLYKNDEAIDLKHSDYTVTWKNCDISILLPASSASIIFTDSKYAKNNYIAITYLIKAQLDRFTNDCYRAAWSGLNAIYGAYKVSERESEQLDNLRKKLDDLEMEHSIGYLKNLSSEFWNQLGWYQFVTSNIGKKKNQLLSPNKNRDPYILNKLIECYRSILKEDTAGYEKQLKRILNGKKEDYKSQLKFLICDYCYMIRNRYFHAAKAYPVFIISNDYEMGNERILTELILLVIKDFLVSDEFR